MIKTKSAPVEEWETLGDPVPTNLSRGIFMDIQGLEGAGKSSLALTLARLGPIVYIDIDQSVDRAQRPEGVPKENIKLHHVNYIASLNDDMMKVATSTAWDLMEERVEKAMKTFAVGAVIDTGSEIWELVRLASAGTLNPKGKRMDRVYGPINAKLRGFLRSIYRGHRKHLVTIHQLKDDYKDVLGGDGEMKSIKTGKLVPGGFKEMKYLADIIVRVERDGPNLTGILQMCKLPPFGPSLEGTLLEGDDLDFRTIVANAMGVSPEEVK